MHKVASIVAAALFALSGCQSQQMNVAYARQVATSFSKDCLSADAPSAVFKNHLTRLCSCTSDRIAQTPMQIGESSDSINAKIQASMKVCFDKLGGNPDAEDYRAVGIPPRADARASG
jgi:hypothetical protein